MTINLLGGTVVGDDTPLGPVVELNRSPLQRPGHDELIWEEVVGGPESARDQRLLIDVRTLEHLLEVAKASLTQRAQLDQVGIHARVWRAKSGHVYATWMLVHKPAKPEMSRALVGGAPAS